MPGHCLNGDTVIIVPGAVNVVLDFFIVALCLPSLRPLVTTLLRGTPSIRNHSTTTVGTFGTFGTTGSEPSKPIWPSRNKSHDNSGGGGRQFKRLSNPFAKHSPWHRDVTVRGGKDTERGSGDDEISLQEMNVPFGQIMVKDEVVITSSDWLEYNDRVY
ncbi:MAG: hypothetical protein Q9208_006388 [Pyrenodesmia sp. 3 TL-2023]